MNHRQIYTAKVKATCDLQTASEGHSRTIPLSHDADPAYVNSDMLIQPNLSYGVVN